MKNFYTQGELKKLSNEELMELTTFGGDENMFYYSDLDKVQASTDSSDGTPEYSFHFTDEKVIYTKDVETFNEVKLGKARYDMLSKSLEAHKSDEEMMQNFFERVTGMVQDKVQEMTEVNQGVQSNIDKNVKNMCSNATNEIQTLAQVAVETVKGLDANNQAVIDLMNKQIEKVTKKWGSKVDELKAFDIEAYNIKMKKVEDIILAFDKLLED